MRRAPLLAALVALVLLVAGCTSAPEDAASSMEEAATLAEDAAETTAAASTDLSAGAGGNATANTTASSNASAPPPEYDYSNCMRGMDMPGCPRAVAEKYFDDLAANRTAPPPDKDLGNFVFVFAPEGAQGATGFTTDEGAMQLLVDVSLNSTGAGPWLVAAPAPGEDIVLQLTGPGSTATISLGGTTAGVDPAAPLADVYRGVVTMPGAGEWTLEILGMGQGAQADVHVIERFYL